MTTPPSDAHDRRTKQIVDNYSLGAGAAMVAVPFPGADMAATFAVWGKMISEIATTYNYEVSLEDGKRLASDIFKGAVMTTFAWFASAKLASGILKLIPGAGTVTAYLVDAVIAGLGAKKITMAVGFSAAAYFKSGKELAPRSILEHVNNLLSSPGEYLKVLGAIDPAFPKDHDGIL